MQHKTRVLNARVGLCVDVLSPRTVTRIVCKGESSEMDLVLDINSDVYPVREGEKLRFVLARTLYEDGTPDDGTYDQSGRVRPRVARDRMVRSERGWGGLLAARHAPAVPA